MRIAESEIELRAALAMLDKHWADLMGYAERKEHVPPHKIVEWGSEDAGLAASHRDQSNA